MAEPKEINFNEEQLQKFSILEKTNAELLKKNTELESIIQKNNNILNDLQKKQAEYDTMLKELETAKQKENEFQEQIKDLHLDKEVSVFLQKYPFVNDLTKNSIANEVKSKLKNNEGTIEEIYNTVTQNLSNIYVTEEKSNSPKIIIPNITTGTNNNGLSREQIEKMSIDEINSNWEEVAKVLKGDK